MTPEQKQQLAELLIESASSTVAQSSLIGLSGIPEGAMNLLCSMPENPQSRQIEMKFLNATWQRIAERIEQLDLPAESRSQAMKYAQREASIYHEQLSVLFRANKVKPDVQSFGRHMNQWVYSKATKLLEEAELTQDMDLSMESVPLPSFHQLCSTNKSGVGL